MAERINVKSKNIKSLLQRADGRVEIEFHRSPDVYITASAIGVDTFRDWLLAESIGTYFHHHIEPIYKIRPKRAADDQPAQIEPEPARLTEEQILVQAIAMRIGRWIASEGQNIFSYSNDIDRDADIALLIKEEVIPHAHKLVLEAIAKKDERLVEGGRICFKLQSEDRAL